MNYLREILKTEGVHYGHLHQNKKLKIMVILFFCGIIGMAGIVVWNGKLFYQNLSPSALRGLYMVSLNQDLHEGDYAVISLPVDIPVLHVKQGYPLLKKVTGIQGDSYMVDDHGTYIHGKLYKTFKREGLPQRKPGAYIVPENTILFLNDPEISFDSRYLGPIDRSYIVKKVILIISYGSFL